MTEPVNTSFTEGKRLGTQEGGRERIKNIISCAGIFKIMTEEDSVRQPDPWSYREVCLHVFLGLIKFAVFC